MPFNPNDYPERPNTGGGTSRFLPPGRHRVTVTQIEPGNPVVVTFSRADGVSRKAWLPTSGGAAFKFANLLRAVGWPHAVDEESAEDLSRVLCGIALEIVVADETYNGKTEAKVKFTNRLPGTTDRAPGGTPPPAPYDENDPPF